MKQYTSNNITLDFDTLQARPGVHSTLGHLNQQATTLSNNGQVNNQTLDVNSVLDMSNNFAISNEPSNFNTTGLLVN